MPQIETPVLPTAARNAEIRRLRALPPKERPSLAELALKHGISRERVRQIEVGENHPEPGDLRYPGGIVLRREREGRFECFLAGKRGDVPQRIGIVHGGRRQWTLERPGRPAVTAESLPAIARVVVGELETRVAA